MSIIFLQLTCACCAGWGSGRESLQRGGHDEHADLPPRLPPALIIHVLRQPKERGHSYIHGLNNYQDTKP
jgi:hypothetical protein